MTHYLGYLFIVFFWSHFNLSGHIFSLFWSQATSCQAAPVWLGGRDLIYWAIVLEITDRGPNRQQIVLVTFSSFLQPEEVCIILQHSETRNWN